MNRTSTLVVETETGQIETYTSGKMLQSKRPNVKARSVSSMLYADRHCKQPKGFILYKGLKLRRVVNNVTSEG